MDALVSRSTGEMTKVKVYTDPRTGAKMAPGAGWNYNPGRAAYFPDLDRYEYTVAKNWISGGLTGPDFERFYQGRLGGNFPVAVLDKQYRALLDAKTQAVYLSSQTLAKNRLKHPDLAIADYRLLPGIIAEAQLVIEEKGQYLLFVKRDEKLYYAVVKATSNRKELFLTSFRRTGERDLRDAMRKGHVIKNEL